MLRETDAFDFDEDISFGLAEEADVGAPPAVRPVSRTSDSQLSVEMRNGVVLPGTEDGSSPDQMDGDPSQRRQRWWSGQEDAILFFLIGFTVTTFTLLVDFFVVELLG